VRIEQRASLRLTDSARKYMVLWTWHDIIGQIYVAA
jgi:hypothetical protein